MITAVLFFSEKIYDIDRKIGLQIFYTPPDRPPPKENTSGQIQEFTIKQKLGFQA